MMNDECEMMNGTDLSLIHHSAFIISHLFQRLLQLFLCLRFVTK